jgi:hypothetical protein
MFTIKAIPVSRGFIVVDETGSNVAIGNDMRPARTDVALTFESESDALAAANQLNGVTRTANSVRDGQWVGRFS